MKRRANLLHFFWIAFASGMITLWYCMRTLSVAGRQDMRSRIDTFARRWSAALLRLIDLKWRVVGELPVLQAERRYIVMCNHASHYDIPVSFLAMPNSLRMLAKKELSRIPVFGRTLRSGEFIFIDRHNRDQALQDLKRARALMESGIVLWVSPEGTRSKDGRLLPFKKGCFHLAIGTGALIIPVGIRGIADVLPKGSMNMNLGVEAEVHVGAPIDASVYTLDRRAELTAVVEQSMRQLLNQPR